MTNPEAQPSILQAVLREHQQVIHTLLLPSVEDGSIFHEYPSLEIPHDDYHAFRMYAAPLAPSAANSKPDESYAPGLGVLFERRLTPPRIIQTLGLWVVYHTAVGSAPESPSLQRLQPTGYATGHDTPIERIATSLPKVMFGSGSDRGINPKKTAGLLDGALSTLRALPQASWNAYRSAQE